MSRFQEDSGKILAEAKSLFLFLQGKPGSGHHKPKGLRLSATAAWNVIYYLQERWRLIPDSIERCSTCGEIFDSYYGGLRVNCDCLCDVCVEA